MSDRNRKGTKLVGCESLQDVEYLVSAPADYKDGADGHNHQGDSLPYLQLTLCVETDFIRITI